MVVVIGLEQIKAKAVEYVEKAESDIISAVSNHAADVRAAMQGSAPWTDRTGEARNLLDASVQPVGTGHFTTASAGLTIPVSGVSQGANFVLSGNSDHNKELEVEEGGKFSIITPTFYREQAVIMGIVKEALDT